MHPVGVEVVSQLVEPMGREPKVVERRVEDAIRTGGCLFDALQEHGRLADAAGSLDADEAGIPVDLMVELTLELHAGGGEATMVGRDERLDVCLIHRKEGVKDDAKIRIRFLKSEKTTENHFSKSEKMEKNHFLKSETLNYGDANG